jgi:cation diffusion facilitator CzcD-associated flavoprotein CzcO
MSRTTSIAIIGTGFGGLGMAIRLKRVGFHNLTLFEKADDVGGCWRDNTYPGAACDVPSHLYSYSFAQNTEWSRRFAPQAEIHQYLRDTADKFGIVPHIRFNAEVTALEFVEATATWAITLEDGSAHVADVIITATGLLSRPLIPGIPGIDTFEGEQFHSATWNHDYDLTGKSVAVVGTGASAIQFVPAIAPHVAHLKLFQKDAAHVIPKPDYAYAHPLPGRRFAGFLACNDFHAGLPTGSWNHAAPRSPGSPSCSHSSTGDSGATSLARSSTTRYVPS